MTVSWQAVTLIHPSAIVRGQWAEEPAQIAHIKRLVKDDYIEPSAWEAQALAGASSPGRTSSR